METSNFRMMWPRFGIKIGNSTLCLAYIKADGSVEVIANKQGDRVSHACLLWNGGDDIECGLTAKQKLTAKPKQGIANSFQFLLPVDEPGEKTLESSIKDIPCNYDLRRNNFALKCETSPSESEESEKTKYLNAFDVHVELLKSELELARQYYNGATLKPVVILSIPSYYPSTAWPLLADAAESAGFHVAQLISESTAAVLAYGIGEAGKTQKGLKIPLSSNKQTRHVLTIKSGGLWSHFALYAIRDGFYTQQESYGPFPIGGRRYDEALVQFICDEFQRKYKLDPHESRRSMAKIRTAAANCKHILTQLPATQVYIDSLMDGIDFNMQMSRARFENLIQPVITEFIGMLNQSVDSALAQHKKEINQIDGIVLLGATTEIPKLQAAIEAQFPKAQIYSSLPSNEVVAIGCARQASFLVDSEGSVELSATDSCICIEEDLHIWHGEDEINAKLIIEKGELLPRTVFLDVVPCTASKETKTFRMRVGNDGKIYETNLNEAKPADDGFFHIEAKIEDTDDAKTPVTTTTPVIHLRCL